MPGHSVESLCEQWYNPAILYKVTAHLCEDVDLRKSA